MSKPPSPFPPQLYPQSGSGPGRMGQVMSSWGDSGSAELCSSDEVGQRTDRDSRRRWGEESPICLHGAAVCLYQTLHPRPWPEMALITREVGSASCHVIPST